MDRRPRTKPFSNRMLISRYVCATIILLAKRIIFQSILNFQVANEELRRELQDKQDLLCQAAKAMELMEGSQKDSHEKTVVDLRQKIEMLEVSAYRWTNHHITWSIL